MKLVFRFCLCVPLCRLLPLPLVRPISEVDVELLKNKSVNKYYEDDRVLYVFIIYDKDKAKEVTQSKYESWDEQW